MDFNQLKVHPFQSCGFRCVNLHPYSKEGAAGVAGSDGTATNLDRHDAMEIYGVRRRRCKLDAPWLEKSAWFFKNVTALVRKRNLIFNLL